MYKIAGNTRVMFIHAGVFILLVPSLLLFKPQSIDAKKTESLFVLRTEVYSWFDLNHQADGNLTPNYSKDRSLLSVRS